MQERRNMIAVDARKRAQAWAEPDASGAVTPVHGRRPHTSDEVGTRNAGAQDSRGQAGPIPVNASTDFLTRRHSNTTSPPAQQQPAAPYSLTHNAPLSALHYGQDRKQQQAPEAPSPYTCPACRNTYQAPSGQHRPAHLPVLLVPCGHSLCRACVVAWTKQQAAQEDGASKVDPTCPLCRAPFSGTAVNQAVVAMLPNALARDTQPMASQADALARATVAGTSELAPLPPALRRTIHDHASDDARASRAEEAARYALAHSRLARLRQEEAGLAATELQDAAASSTSQAVVERALSNELGLLEAELKRLELERNVVLSQLGEVLQRKAGCGVREHECARRHNALSAVADVHRATSDQQRHAAYDMVPSPAVLSLLDEALSTTSRGSGYNGL
jgi:hypothetical protein